MLHPPQPLTDHFEYIIMRFDIFIYTEVSAMHNRNNANSEEKSIGTLLNQSSLELWLPGTNQKGDLWRSHQCSSDPEKRISEFRDRLLESIKTLDFIILDNTRLEQKHLTQKEGGDLRKQLGDISRTAIYQYGRAVNENDSDSIRYLDALRENINRLALVVSEGGQHFDEYYKINVGLNVEAAEMSKSHKIFRALYMAVGIGAGVAGVGAAIFYLSILSLILHAPAMSATVGTAGTASQASSSATAASNIVNAVLPHQALYFSTLGVGGAVIGGAATGLYDSRKHPLVKLDEKFHALICSDIFLKFFVNDEAVSKSVKEYIKQYEASMSGKKEKKNTVLQKTMSNVFGKLYRQTDAVLRVTSTDQPSEKEVKEYLKQFSGEPEDQKQNSVSFERKMDDIQKKPDQNEIDVNVLISIVDKYDRNRHSYRYFSHTPELIDKLKKLYVSSPIKKWDIKACFNDPKHLFDNPPEQRSQFTNREHLICELGDAFKESSSKQIEFKRK